MEGDRLKKLVMMGLVLVFLMGLFLVISGYRLSSYNALRSWNKGVSFTVLNEYYVDRKNSFLLFKDNYDIYGVAEIETFWAFERITNIHRNIAESDEGVLSHLAFWSGGYYFDYIFIQDKDVKYVVAGDLNSISEYDGNLTSIIEHVNRYKDIIIVHQNYDATTCFWGKVEDEEILEVGKISAFDVQGNNLFSEIIY